MSAQADSFVERNSTNPIRRDWVEVATQACREGRRVTLDHFHSQAGTTPRASVENANRAIAENRAGRFLLTVFDASGNQHVHGVSREDAERLVVVGAEFVGQPWRAP